MISIFGCVLMLWIVYCMLFVWLLSLVVIGVNFWCSVLICSVLFVG